MSETFSLLAGRNGTGEFARRSMKNLDFIVASTCAGCDVHPVTQSVATLLAIFVFPWERSAFNAVKKKRLPVAMSEGWPAWSMSGPKVHSEKVKTVGNLLELLRGSVAHANVFFDSDSRNVKEVTITFKHYPKGTTAPDWEGSIKADQLIEFCRRFSGFIEDYVS